MSQGTHVQVPALGVDTKLWVCRAQWMLGRTGLALFMKLGHFPMLPGPASSLPAAWSRPSGQGLEWNVDSSKCNLSRLLSRGPGGAQVPLDVLDSVLGVHSP